MNKFLTIGMMIVIMSLLSCSSGPLGMLAATILPLFAIIGVGLMTLNVLVANGHPQNLAAEPNDPAVVLGNFMDVMLAYCAQCARGVFFGIGQMISWGMPNRIGAGAEQAPQAFPAQALPPQPLRAQPLPPSVEFAGGQGEGQAAQVPGRVKIKIHIHIHKKSRSERERARVRAAR